MQREYHEARGRWYHLEDDEDDGLYVRQPMEHINSICILLVEEQMPRFHFEIIDGFRIKDPVGMECTEAQAKEVAVNIAKNIAIDVGVHAARKVVVVDDEGSKLHEVPIGAAAGKI